MALKPLILLLPLACSYLTHAQDTPTPGGSDTAKLNKITQQYVTDIGKKSDEINRAIDRQTAQYLSTFQKEEAHLYKKLAKRDSTAAARAMAASKKQYETLQQKLNATSQTISTKTKRYIPLLDTLSTSLKFLKQYGDLFKKGIATSQQLSSTLSQVNGVEGKLQQADDVQAFIKDRQQQLTAQLQQAGMSNALSGFNKDAYYYSAQMSEYRAALNDPDKAEQKAIALLNRLPAFQQFMKQNSFLASLFSAPGSSSIATTALQGLQTRSQVQQLVQNQISAGGPNAQGMVEQNIQAAQAQLNGLKDKLSKLGGGNSDAAMPDFKPNMQKTKTFLQRLEYGANVQTQRSGNFFPTTTDLALSAGYKLNDKNTIGLGIGYKWGWGQDIKHIAISSQGIDFRSYVDIKIKGSFYATGGFEYNYQQPFSSLQQINSLNAWTKSGLIGISKEISVKNKFFKKAKLQLLWDFLSYQQIPVTPPIKFRIGYTF